MEGLKIKHFFDTNYPLDLAYEWDNVGLQIGNLDKAITGIVIALDLTLEIIDEAIEKGANLIISHHPFIFRPLKNILTDTYKGNVIKKLFQNDLTLYVSHTNYDLGHHGMNTVLAEKLGLRDSEPLEMVDEAHGIGRIGKVDAMPLEAAIKHIKSALNIDHARLIAKTNPTSIKKIAICGGSGSSDMFEAKRKGADIYLTGDISYHQAHDLLQMDMIGLDIGHYAEKHFAKALKQELNDFGVDCPIYVSEEDLDPFKFV